MKKPIVKALVAIAAVLGCTGAFAKPLKITWVLGNASLQAVALIRGGFTQYLQENKITDWTVTYLDSKGSAEATASNIQDAVARGAEVILISVSDLRASNAALAAATKANIPVFTTDSGAVPGNIQDMTSNNWSMSADVSAALINKMGGKGNLVILTADGILPVRQRADALKAVLKEYPNIKVITEHSLKVGNFYQEAMNVMQDATTRYGKEIHGVWTGWDEPAQAAVAVLNKAGMGKVPVTGMDGLKFAVDAVCDPASGFYATSSQQFAGWGAKLAEVTKRISNGETPDKVTRGIRTLYFPTTLLTKETCPAK